MCEVRQRPVPLVQYGRVLEARNTRGWGGQDAVDWRKIDCGAVLRFTMPLAKTQRPAPAGEAGVDPAASSVAGARVGGGFDIAQFLT